jgi:hypothetical protein
MRPAHIHRHRPVRPAARHRVHTQLDRLPPPSRAGIRHHKHVLTPGDQSVSPNWTFCTQHTIHPRGGPMGTESSGSLAPRDHRWLRPSHEIR